MKTQLTVTLGAAILICGLGFAEPAAAVTLTVGTNINLTKLVNHQTETTIAVNPLNLAHARTNSLLAWANPSTGFVLQENPGLTSVGWTNSQFLPQIVGGRKQISLAPTNGSRFFRLVHP